MGLSGAAIGTYRPQYRPLSVIRYLDVNPLPTRYTLFITLPPVDLQGSPTVRLGKASSTRAGSWGFLIRDHDGDVLTDRGKINNALSAFHSELIACLQGVQVASDLGIDKLILETDALNVQQAVQAKGYDTRSEGGLIEELKSLARSNFNAFVCNFLGRDGNRAAHALAGLGYSCIEGEALITSTIPDDVFVIVSDDLSAE